MDIYAERSEDKIRIYLNENKWRAYCSEAEKFRFQVNGDICLVLLSIARLIILDFKVNGNMFTEGKHFIEARPNILYFK